MLDERDRQPEQPLRVRLGGRPRILAVETPQDADALAAQTAGLGRVRAPAVAHNRERGAQRWRVTCDHARHAVDETDRKHAAHVEAAVGGAQRHGAVIGRRNAQRAAIVAADGERHEARADRDRRAARGAARALLGVVGVADPSAGAREPANAHRELVHVGLADDDGAGLAHALDERRVARRLIADERERPDGRRHVVGVEIVLHRHRHAEQPAALLAGRGPSVERLGLRDRVGIEREEGVERRPLAGVEIARGDVGLHRADRGGARGRSGRAGLRVRVAGGEEKQQDGKQRSRKCCRHGASGALVRSRALHRSSMLWSMARSNLPKGPPKPPKRRCRASKFQ